MKKSDVKEALRWVGAIGEEMGGRVTQLVKRVEGGGKEHFKFEEWLDLVEEVRGKYGRTKHHIKK